MLYKHKTKQQKNFVQLVFHFKQCLRYVVQKTFVVLSCDKTTKEQSTTSLQTLRLFNLNV